MYLLGYDCGTSSSKAMLLDVEDGSIVGAAISPEKEMPIIAVKNGWAEQKPLDWWGKVPGLKVGLVGASG